MISRNEKLYREERHFECQDFFVVMFREAKYLNVKLSYVYLLLCADDSYYTGVTSNIEKRFLEHQTGKHIR